MEHEGWRNAETAAETDEQRLRDFGYKPQFRRVLGLFANFSLGYSYMAPLGGIYELFAYALTKGGPAFFWTMPAVLLGQILVASVQAEAASQYPIAGGVYQWSRRLAGPRWGFLTAWMYLLALLGTCAGLAAALAPYLVPLLGMDAMPTLNAVAGLGIIALAAVANFMGTRTLARIAELGVWSGLVGLALCGGWLLLFGRVQPVSVLALGPDLTHGPSSSALLAACLIGIWSFFGHEACGDLAEEVAGASRKVPKAMMLTMIVGGGSALVIALGLVLAVPDMALAVSGKDANPADTLLRHAFGPLGADFVLICLTLVIVSAIASVIASASRLLFSLGRDGVIFGAEALQRVDATRGVPVAAVTVASIVPAILVSIGFFSANAVEAIISFATSAIYTAFAMTVFASLLARVGGWRPSGHFRLGALGWPVTIAALAFGIAAVTNLCWPRPEAADASWYITWINALSLVAIMATGVAQLGRTRRLEAIAAAAE